MSNVTQGESAGQKDAGGGGAGGVTKGGAGGGEEKSRYRATLNLPQTSFPMKANLVQNEPASMKRWAGMKLYEKVREARKDAGKFVFHDGPPYANGSIHLGHLMNKCFKDFVVRSKTMQNLDCAYVPGWDCHGLPIEHKVMTELLENKKYDKIATLDEWQRKMAVRRECQKHAEKYIKLQAGQMQRLLTLADYEHPYMTMSKDFEAATLDVLATLMEKGLVYRALKPVHWSIANETALAEAELEYYDREDLSVYVDFEADDAEAVYKAFGVGEAPDEEEEEGGHEEVTEKSQRGHEDGNHEEKSETRIKIRPGFRPHQRPSFMIWTTTPWTLPANLAIAVNPKLEYALVWIDGNVTVLAAGAIERVTQKARSEEVVVIARTSGDKLVGLKYRHPFMKAESARTGTVRLTAVQGADPVFTVAAADYVTLEDGTGLVHTAPGHGVEDYQTGLRIGLPVYCPVKGNGTYDETVPEWLRGMSVWDANKAVTQHLKNSGHLFYDHTFMHSYPHDWRSKTPTIFRCTEQWFVSVDGGHEGSKGGPDLRALALEATQPGVHNTVAFVPEWGRNRMRGMLESRPDWCISRQRSWGLPIPAFILPDGKAFMTPASLRAVMAVVREKGSDAWFQLTPEELLKGYDAKSDPHAPAAVKEDPSLALRARKGGDILDVWFESGCSWNAVMRQRNLGFPAELYLEGSDQHRGWFQVSLLPSLGVTGQPPYKCLLTHGFMVDKDGKKLSKSRTDAARYEVDSLASEFGVDVMRWWVSSLAYENDVKVDLDFFALAGESYRKVRNTLRFMLSNLSDWKMEENSAAERRSTQYPTTSPDAWILGEFDRVREVVVKAYNEYDFATVHKTLFDFCNATLSAEYFPAVKDRLYCDKPDSPRRRRTQAAMWELTDGLCRLLAPIMCHTADEAYRALRRAGNDDPACVHLSLFPPASGVKADEAWATLLGVFKSAQIVMEKSKATLGVENPLDMGVVIVDATGTLSRFDRVDLADYLGVSEVTIESSGETRVVDLRARPRCDRSWRRDGTVKARSDGGMLSDRDAEAVGMG
jgi:isoleucyl-tRNA synthetase